MQFMACSPIKAEVQLAFNSFHYFSFTHDTFAVSAHAAAHVNQKHTVLQKKTSTHVFFNISLENV